MFDLKTGGHLKTLTTFDTPHAMFLVPGTDRMIVTDSGRGYSRILSTRTYQVLGRIKLAPGADSSAYDPSTGRFYIVTGGGDVGMKVSYLNEIEPRTAHLLRRLRLDSDHTEAVRAEQHGDRLFVNIADQDYVAVVDKKTFKVTARWPITGASTNLSMALDEPDRRLFVVTRKPTRMFVLDTDDGKTVATLDVPAIVDSVFYDSARKRIYVPGAVGEIGVYQQIDPNHYRELARVPSAAGAKSALLVPALNRFYVAASPGERVGGAVLWYALEPP
ncbi:MAG: YncE family protein [Mycobacterium sp.]